MQPDALAIVERNPSNEMRDTSAHDIAAALHNLGASFAVRGRLTEAVEMLGRALRLKRRVLGTRHPDVAVTMNNLASVLEQTREHGRADLLYAEAVDILTEKLGPEHPKTMKCRRNQGALRQVLRPSFSGRRSTLAG